jgi:hypothetical protein
MTDRYFYAGGEAYTADGVTTYLNLLKDDGAAITVVDMGSGVTSTRHKLAAAVPGPVQQIVLMPGSPLPPTNAAAFVWYLDGATHKIVKLSRLTFDKVTAWATDGIYTVTGTCVGIAVSSVDSGYLAVGIAGTGTDPDVVFLDSTGAIVSGWGTGKALPNSQDIGACVGINGVTGNVVCGPKTAITPSNPSYSMVLATTPAGMRVPFVACSTDGQYIVACGASSGDSNRVYVSEDGGTTFIETGPMIGISNNWSCVASSANGQYVYMGVRATAVGKQKLYRSTNYGRVGTWSECPVDGFTGVDRDWSGVACSSDGRYVMAVSEGNATGKTFYSADYGAAFDSTGVQPNVGDLTGHYQNFDDVVCNAAGSEFAVGHQNYGYVWFGKIVLGTWTWTRLGASGGGQENRIGSGKLAWPRNNDSLVYAIGCNPGTGSGMRSVCTGGVWAAWTALSAAFASTSYAWTDITCDDTGTKIAASVRSTNGGLYISIDSAVSTKKQSGIATDEWASCTLSGDGNTVFVGIGGSVATNCLYQGTPGFGGDELYDLNAAAGGGHYYYYGVACSSDGLSVAVGLFNNGVWLRHGIGGTWTHALAGVTVYSVSMSEDGNTVYACRSTDAVGGRLYKVVFSGGVWQAPVELTPAGAVDLKWTCIRCSGTYVIACCYNGGAGKGVYYSSNGGDSWTDAALGSTTWYSCAISSDGVTMVAGNYAGALYLKVGGEAWSDVSPVGGGTADWVSLAMASDGTYIYALDNNAGRAWCRTGGVWAEVRPLGDVGKAWRSVACSSTGQHLLVALYVLTTGTTHYSDDFGATWSDVTIVASVGDWWSTAMSGDGALMYMGRYAATGHAYDIVNIKLPQVCELSRVDGSIVTSYSNNSALRTSGWTDIVAYRYVLGDSKPHWFIRVKSAGTSEVVSTTATTAVKRSLSVNAHDFAVNGSDAFVVGNRRFV